MRERDGGGKVTIYEIGVKGHLDRGWSEWFDGLEITDQENGEAPGLLLLGMKLRWCDQNKPHTSSGLNLPDAALTFTSRVTSLRPPGPMRLRCALA